MKKQNKEVETEAPEAPEVPVEAIEALGLKDAFGGFFGIPGEEPPEKAELAALKDRYARLLADFDNYRKRQAREREDWVKRANESLLEDFLPVADHLELALGNAPDGPFAEGVRLVYGQFAAALEKHGVTPLDAKGQPFNPDWHEALSQVPSDTVPENGVVEQFRRGWCIGGKLLRPAQVIVSSGKPAGEAPEASTPTETEG